MTNVMAELLDEFQREKDCFAKALLTIKLKKDEYIWKNLIVKTYHTRNERYNRTNKSQLYVPSTRLILIKNS